MAPDLSRLFLLFSMNKPFMDDLRPERREAKPQISAFIDPIFETHPVICQLCAADWEKDLQQHLIILH